MEKGKKWPIQYNEKKIKKSKSCQVLFHICSSFDELLLYGRNGTEQNGTGTERNGTELNWNGTKWNGTETERNGTELERNETGTKWN